jgi:hypothetical protein
MWSENEKSKSSTWKEMKAIEQALITFKEVNKYKNIKWYTDNQNCVKIVRSGSRMHLQLRSQDSKIEN